MKKVFLASASIAAGLMGGQALAQSGYVGASYSSVEVEVLGLEGEGDGFGLEGAASFSEGPGIGFAIDGKYQDFSDAGDGTFSAAAHLFNRSETSLFGGYVSAADSGSSTTWGIGGEAQAFLSSATLGASVGYLDMDSVSGFGVNGNARFYPMDNFSLGGNVGFYSLEGDGGGEADATEFGLSAEYQLSGAPISLLAGYTMADLEIIESSAWTVGLRYNWGGTLKERDQSGGSLAPLAEGISGLGL